MISQEDFDYQLSVYESNIMKLVKSTKLAYGALGEVNYNSSTSDISHLSSDCKSDVYSIMIRIISAFDENNKHADEDKLYLSNDIREYINEDNFDEIIRLLYVRINDIKLAIELFGDMKKNIIDMSKIADDISYLMEEIK